MAFRDENGRKPLPPTPWEPGYRTHRRFHDAVEYLPAQEWPAAPNNSPASTSSRKHKRTGAADWTRIPQSPDYCVQGSNDVFHDPPKPEISRTNAQSDVGPSNSQPSTTSTAVVGTFHRANVVFNAQRQSRASIGLPLEVLEPETPQYVPRSSQIDNPSSRLSPGTRITQIAHGPTLYTSRNADNILLHGPERAPKFGELFPGLRGGVLGAGVEEEESAKAQSSKGKGKERLYTVSDASSEAHEAQPAQESPPVDVQRLSGLLPIVSALRPGPRTGDSPIYTAGSLFPPYIPSGPGTMPDVSRVLQASAQPPASLARSSAGSKIKSLFSRSKQQQHVLPPPVPARSPRRPAVDQDFVAVVARKCVEVEEMARLEVEEGKKSRLEELAVLLKEVIKKCI